MFLVKMMGKTWKIPQTLAESCGAHPRDPSVGSWQLGQMSLEQGVWYQLLITRLSHPSFLGSEKQEVGSWAEGPCLTPQRLIGHRLLGAAPPLPFKGALCHHKEALSLTVKPGCCHGDRGGQEEGGPPSCGGERAFLVYTGR